MESTWTAEANFTLCVTKKDKWQLCKLAVVTLENSLSTSNRNYALFINIYIHRSCVYTLRTYKRIVVLDQQQRLNFHGERRCINVYKYTKQENVHLRNSSHRWRIFRACISQVLLPRRRTQHDACVVNHARFKTDLIQAIQHFRARDFHVSQ